LGERIPRAAVDERDAVEQPEATARQENVSRTVERLKDRIASETVSGSSCLGGQPRFAVRAASEKARGIISPDRLHLRCCFRTRSVRLPLKDIAGNAGVQQY
jgi:hypothetical protein